MSSELVSNPAPTREQIIRLQEAMLPQKCEQPEPTHFFAPGMYLRELTVPAGMLLVGKTHRHAHFLVVTKGRAEVISEFGRTVVEPGHIAVSQAGVKRVVLALEDTQFITVHLSIPPQSETAKRADLCLHWIPAVAAVAFRGFEPRCLAL